MILRVCVYVCMNVVSVQFTHFWITLGNCTHNILHATCNPQVFAHFSHIFVYKTQKLLIFVNTSCRPLLVVAGKERKI